MGQNNNLRNESKPFERIAQKYRIKFLKMNVYPQDQSFYNSQVLYQLDTQIYV